MKNIQTISITEQNGANLQKWDVVLDKEIVFSMLITDPLYMPNAIMHKLYEKGISVKATALYKVKDGGNLIFADTSNDKIFYIWKKCKTIVPRSSCEITLQTIIIADSLEVVELSRKTGLNPLQIEAIAPHLQKLYDDVNWAGETKFEGFRLYRTHIQELARFHKITLEYNCPS